LAPLPVLQRKLFVLNLFLVCSLRLRFVWDLEIGFCDLGGAKANVPAIHEIIELLATGIPLSTIYLEFFIFEY
jgi:hypothetical protein